MMLAAVGIEPAALGLRVEAYSHRMDFVWLCLNEY